MDDDTAPWTEVFAFAHSLLNQKMPDTKVSSVSSSESQKQEDDCNKRMKGQKRVSNARLKNELGVKLLRPTYKSGL